MFGLQVWIYRRFLMRLNVTHCSKFCIHKRSWWIHRGSGSLVPEPNRHNGGNPALFHTTGGQTSHILSPALFNAWLGRNVFVVETEVGSPWSRCRRSERCDECSICWWPSCVREVFTRTGLHDEELALGGVSTKRNQNENFHHMYRIFSRGL